MLKIQKFYITLKKHNIIILDIMLQLYYKINQHTKRHDRHRT